MIFGRTCSVLTHKKLVQAQTYPASAGPSQRISSLRSSCEDSGSTILSNRLALISSSVPNPDPGSISSQFNSHREQTRKDAAVSVEELMENLREWLVSFQEDE
ncbi:hypothetical protein SAY87_013777 [Trapa incisa]|uniref:Uncharacterized protein n=1 Tax=Trapa incisa TaxID=236973 RepID=A0AAN7KG05_9MYRT|nr:hypothetical protein SAY87_013777 [Trapa incisa]